MKNFKRISKLVVALAVVFVVLVSSVIPAKAASQHTVTFLYGTKSYVAVVPHGGSVMPPADTFVPGFTFIGWVGSSIGVTEDRIILGAYNPIPQPAPVASVACYNVRFVDGITGEEYYHETVSRGAAANPVCPPAHCGYHFAYYDGDYTNVTCDRTIVAVYASNCGCCGFYAPWYFGYYCHPCYKEECCYGYGWWPYYSSPAEFKETYNQTEQMVDNIFDQVKEMCNKYQF